MLCSFGELVTDATKDEMESSSCSLVSTPSLMLSTTTVFGTKGNSLVLKKSGPLTQILDCKISADMPRVPASAGLSQVGDVVSLVNAGVFQDFTNPICNEDGVFVC